MTKLKSEDFLEKIPDLFKINLKSDKEGANIFQKLGEVFEFEFGYIYYLNPDTVQLKYSNINKELTDSIYKISKKDLDFLYSEKGCILDTKSSIIKSLNFVGGKSYILHKLKVGNTVFGFIVLGSSKENIYNKDDLARLKICN
jgi:hypothetical protein